MVNVGGRSKGCAACLRRRVKCDETRPICKRCQKRGIECEGVRDITFVEGKIVRSRRTERATLSTRRDVGDTASAECQIPVSPSLRGMELVIYICYTQKHLRRGAPIDLAMQEIQLSDISTTGTTTAISEGQIFLQAILSFAMIFFGTRHGQAPIINQGYTIHGAALKQLNEALQDSKCYARDEVVLSVATLAILEGYIPTGPKHYLMHIAGLERLLELRSPKSCSPKSFELYKAVRHLILFASLRVGKPSILARAEWKALFRANCSNEEMQEQDLFDILADCTVLAAERGRMLENIELKLDLESGPHQRNEINQRALGLLNHLCTWKKQWDSDGRNSYFETPIAFAGVELVQESGADDLAPFLTTFEFSNDSAAVMLMFYNTTLIYVFRILASLALENPATPSGEIFMQNTLQDTGPLENYAKHGNIAAELLAASEICRCIPDYLKRKSGLESNTSPIFHWAITTAWMTLRGKESAEGRWMMKLFSTKSREVVARGLLVS